jgi:hypothetical protein
MHPRRRIAFQSRSWQRPAVLLLLLGAHALLLVIAAHREAVAVPAVAAPMILRSFPPETPEVASTPASRGHADRPIPTPRNDRTATAIPPCESPAILEASLLPDAAVGDALAALPPSALSPTGAIALWTDGWHPLSIDGAPLAALRQAVVAAIGAMPRSCRDASIAGARLLVMTTDAGARVLAFGAARWSWQMVAESEDFLPAGGNPTGAAAYQPAEGPPIASPAPGATVDPSMPEHGRST